MNSSNEERLSSFIAATRATSPRVLIHHLLNGVGRHRGGELSGPWLVAALGELGHRQAAARQMLRRMLATGELDMRRQGRVNHYRLGSFSRTGSQAGQRKLFEAPPDWDGRWTLALYQFQEAEREVRDHVRLLLAYQGFGALARGVFIHPHDRVEAMTGALDLIGQAGRVHLLRAEQAAGPSDREMASSAWDLDSLVEGYRSFEQRHRGLDPEALEPREAFVVYTAVVQEFFDVALRDPELPARLLPEDWTGRAAQALARQLLVGLQPGLIAHADTLPGTPGQRARRSRRGAGGAT
jgi:phenylacetic acid degradation operon negative regulatory protein